MDPEAVELAKLAGGGYAAWRAVDRVLGGSVDAIGDFLETLTRRKCDRVLRTIENGEKKLRPRPPEAGRVDERVQECVFQAANSDNPWVVDYLGGVLASSRNADMPDDRGARVALAIAQLSAYQLRAHYAFYRIMREKLRGVASDTLDRAEMAANYRVFVPRGVANVALDLQESDNDQRYRHMIYGLRQDHLIGLFAEGNVKSLIDKGYEVEEPGLVIQPYNVGIELFMWAHGAGWLNNVAFFDSDLELRLFDAEQEVTIPPGSRRVPKPEPSPA